jgi:hypothetical protein
MNTPSIGLTSDELYQVTHYRNASKQIHALALMDIPFKVRPDGTVFVARVAIEGSPSETQTNNKTDWVVNM